MTVKITVNDTLLEAREGQSVLEAAREPQTLQRCSKLEAQVAVAKAAFDVLRRRCGDLHWSRSTRRTRTETQFVPTPLGWADNAS